MLAKFDSAAGCTSGACMYLQMATGYFDQGFSLANSTLSEVRELLIEQPDLAKQLLPNLTPELIVDAQVKLGVGLSTVHKYAAIAEGELQSIHDLVSGFFRHFW